MRRLARVSAVLLAFGLLTFTVAQACGDKSLRIGRGVRFRRTSHPAAVLIYIPSNNTRATQLQSLLKKVGHKSYAVQALDGVSEALRSGHYDLIFSDVSAVPDLERQIQNSSAKPIIVPVVSEGTKAEVAAAKKQYKYFVKDPHSADRYLEAIDDALSSRIHLLAKKS